MTTKKERQYMALQLGTRILGYSQDALMYLIENHFDTYQDDRGLAAADLILNAVDMALAKIEEELNSQVVRETSNTYTEN